MNHRGTEAQKETKGTKEANAARLANGLNVCPIEINLGPVNPKPEEFSCQLIVRVYPLGLPGLHPYISEKFGRN